VLNDIQQLKVSKSKLDFAKTDINIGTVTKAWLVFSWFYLLKRSANQTEFQLKGSKVMGAMIVLISNQMY
jgi:hypothetical protein